MGYTYQKYEDEFKCRISRTKVVRLYQTWADMLKRCKPTARECERVNYYDKGIRVCEEWHDWPTFATWARANGYTDELEIDRIDGTKGYYADNCRFVTEVVQNHNRDQISFVRNCVQAQRALHTKPFICLETGEIFNTQAEAAQLTGVCASQLSVVLNGKGKIAGGYHWNYLVNSEAGVEETLVST